MGILIIAGAIALQACTGSGGTGSVDTVATIGKTGTYISRGSFTGGEVTDGRDVHDIEWSLQDGFERIEIRIHEGKWGDSENASPVAVPCWFTASREDFPARLLVTVGGTRMFSAAAPELPADALVRSFYRIIYLDDSGAMFAFDLDSDTEFEVFERHDPAVIVIDVRPVRAGSRGGPKTVFSLRSASQPQGERLGHFQEELMIAGATDSRIIRDAEGEFFVEEGLYAGKKEAEARQRLLSEKDIVLFIKERGPADQPRNINSEEK